MQKYVCPCGYVYDPAVGDPDNGIAPGTPGSRFLRTGFVPPADWARTCLKRKHETRRDHRSRLSLSTGVRSAGWLPFAGMFRHALQRAGLAEMLAGAAQSACGTIRPDNSAVHPKGTGGHFRRGCGRSKPFSSALRTSSPYPFKLYPGKVQLAQNGQQQRFVGVPLPDKVMQASSEVTGVLGNIGDGETRELRERAVPGNLLAHQQLQQSALSATVAAGQGHTVSRLQSKGQGAAHWPSAIVGNDLPQVQQSASGGQGPQLERIGPLQIPQQAGGLLQRF